jgi:hypothetical protein
MAQNISEDHDLTPSIDTSALNTRPEPGATNVVFPVPTDMVNAGHSTNEPQADSPESLDQAISEGLNREEVDQEHTIVRPAIDTIDKEENGAD